jgi:hypothetical protein
MATAAIDVLIKPKDFYTAVVLGLLGLRRPRIARAIRSRVDVATRRLAVAFRRVRSVPAAALAAVWHDDVLMVGGLGLVGVGLWLVLPSAALIVVGLTLFAMSGAVGTIRRRV